MEAKGSFQFQESMNEYQTAIDEGRGALLFAVCRGKVSEGFGTRSPSFLHCRVAAASFTLLPVVDFTDRAARAVVITGLPFAPIAAAKVRLKCQYMDSAHRHGAGQLWYSQQAYRAVVRPSSIVPMMLWMTTMPLPAESGVGARHPTPQ